MKKLILAGSLYFLSACVSFTPQLGFEDVSQTVESRTGHPLHWNTGTEADREVEAALSRLLAEPLTADTATRAALLGNNQLQATYQDLGIAQADLVEAGLLPNFLFSGEFRFPSGGPSIELSLVQSFIDILQIPLRKKIAESRFEEAKIEVAERAVRLAYQIRRSFYEYQGSEQLLELSKTALEALEASRDLARRLYDAGNIPEIDRIQEEVNYETVKIENALLEERVARTREDLNALMGLAPSRINWKTAVRLPEPSPLERNPQAIEEQAIANNLELARIRQRIVTLGANLEQAERFRLFGSGDLGVAGARESDSGWGFGPAFSFPLPLFNWNQPAIFRAHAELSRQNGLGMDQTTRIQARVRSILKRIRITEGRLKTYKRLLLPLHVKLVSEAQKQYNAMSLSAFQLLETKRKQILAGRDYIQSLNDYWSLQTELDSILSGSLPGNQSISLEEE